LILKRLSFISAERARAFLKLGALVVDVRNPGEFDSGHLPGAVNIPLGDLSRDLPRRVPDKSKILLLHCLSGARSGIARQQLRKLGYAQAYNLGSYRRAEAIVRAS
jgi:phage shock protein E